MISRSAASAYFPRVNVPRRHVGHVQTIDTTIDKSEVSFRYLDAIRRNGVQGGTHLLDRFGSSRPAQKERKWRGGRGLLPPWDGRKVEFSSPDTRLWPAVPVYLVHSAVTRGVPKPPVLCIVIGWAEFENAPALTQGRVHYNIIDLYIQMVSLSLLDLLNRLLPQSPSRHDPSENLGPAQLMTDGPSVRRKGERA